MQVKAEKPAWHLGVISGALLRTMEQVASNSADYMGYLEKGQLPPARLSLTRFLHTFVLEGARCCSALLATIWLQSRCLTLLACLSNFMQSIRGRQWFPGERIWGIAAVLCLSQRGNMCNT